MALYSFVFIVFVSNAKDKHNFCAWVRHEHGIQQYILYSCRHENRHDLHNPSHNWSTCLSQHGLFIEQKSKTSISWTMQGSALAYAKIYVWRDKLVTSNLVEIEATLF